ncbi:MAG TPA: hypothetical protein VHP38_10905, partial [Ruminiclostridium sp.]|nr:hypothetical protein [Ruminiclostridium sp.]
FKPTPEEIEENIKELCDSLNDAAEELKGTKLVYTVYFRDNGDILSRELENKADKVDISFVSYRETTGNDILKFDINDDGEKIINFESSKRLDNGIYKGKFDLGIQGSSVLNTEYSVEKDAKVGGRPAFIGDIKGTLKLKDLQKKYNNYTPDNFDYDDTQFDGTDSATYEEQQVSNNIDDVNFSFSNKRQDSNTLLGEATASTKVNGKSVNIAFNTKLLQSDKANITKPYISLDNSIDVNDYSKIEDLSKELKENMADRMEKVLRSLKIKDN